MTPHRPLLRRVLIVLAAAVLTVATSGAMSADAANTGPVFAQLNLCGGSDCAGTDGQKSDWFASTLAARQVTAASLNETCASQLQLVLDGLRSRGYRMYAEFVPIYPAGKARCAGGEFGNAVLTRAPAVAVRRMTFQAQLTATEKRAVICVLTQLQKRVQICSTHLTPGPLKADVRERQAAETKALIDQFRVPVVLMGDLNANPTSDSFDRFYSAAYGAGAFGVFVEGGSTRNGALCRCGTPTRDGVKLDYVFVSGSTFGAGTSETVDSPYSDHHLVLARPTWL